jgi:hypothetical protein
VRRAGRQVADPSTHHKMPGAPSFRSFIAEGWETTNPALSKIHHPERSAFQRTGGPGDRFSSLGWRGVEGPAFASGKATDGRLLEPVRPGRPGIHPRQNPNHPSPKINQRGASRAQLPVTSHPLPTSRLLRAYPTSASALAIMRSSRIGNRTTKPEYSI